MISLRHSQFAQGDSFPESGTVLSPSRKWET
jgi:hypothetical protein